MIKSTEEKNNIILDNSKHNLIYNNRNNSFKSIPDQNPKKQLTINKVLYKIENTNKIKKVNSIKREKEIDSLNGKNKNNNIRISLFTHKNNDVNKNKLRSKSTFFKKSSENLDEIWKKDVKFNSFYYYCLGAHTKNKEEKQLFNLALSFYKQKMDIIYLFHMILLIEKIWEKMNGIIKNDEEMMFTIENAK